MTYKSLLKRTKLDEKSLEEISQAVKAAESKTTGEIALALAAESSNYALWEVLASIGTAMLLFLCIFPLAPQIYAWIETKFWVAEPWYLSVFYLAVCALVSGILYFLYNIPEIDSLVIPTEAKKSAVSSRALKYFAQSGIYATENHNGILIFVSYFEKQVRIIADKGICSKISNDLWNLVSDEMAENLSNGNVKEAYIQAVQKCGELLAQSFPLESEAKNELSDGLAILENEKWL